MRSGYGATGLRRSDIRRFLRPVYQSSTGVFRREAATGRVALPPFPRCAAEASFLRCAWSALFASCRLVRPPTRRVAAHRCQSRFSCALLPVGCLPCVPPCGNDYLRRWLACQPTHCRTLSPSVSLAFRHFAGIRGGCDSRVRRRIACCVRYSFAVMRFAPRDSEGRRVAKVDFCIVSGCQDRFCFKSGCRGLFFRLLPQRRVFEHLLRRIAPGKRYDFVRKRRCFCVVSHVTREIGGTTAIFWPWSCRKWKKRLWRAPSLRISLQGAPPHPLCRRSRCSLYGCWTPPLQLLQTPDAPAAASTDE